MHAPCDRRQHGHIQRWKLDVIYMLIIAPWLKQNYVKKVSSDDDCDARGVI